MPPKPKFTKEEIITAALKIVSKKGTEGLTARELGEVLGSSARPIFTVFKNMEELQDEVSRAAMQYFEQFSISVSPDMPIFKQIGMKMVLFGVKEPKLYQLLFMRESQTNAVSYRALRKQKRFDWEAEQIPDTKLFEDIFNQLGETAILCIQAVQTDYGLSLAQAYYLFQNVWIYTFGIGALCATGMHQFSEEQIGQLLTTEFRAMMKLIKSETDYPLTK